MFNIPLAAQQESNAPIKIVLEAGVLAGVEVNRNTGDFKRAPMFRTGILYHLNSQISIGGGLGLEWYKKERLFPIYADMRLSKRKDEARAFFAVHAGYTPGWHQEYQQLENYELNGGWRIGFDYGWLVPAGELELNMSIGLHIQNLQIDIDTGFSDDYCEDVTYVLLGFKTGLIF